VFKCKSKHTRRDLLQEQNWTGVQYPAGPLITPNPTFCMAKKAAKTAAPATASSNFIASLPEAYRDMVGQLDDADIAFIEKFSTTFDSYKEFSNLIEIGIYMSKRKAEMKAKGESGYGDRLMETFGTVTGVPASTVASITRSVDLFGGPYLQQLVVNAKAKGIKLSNAHIREMHRIESPDYAVERQTIIARIFDQELVTSRQVQDAVNQILGLKHVDVVVPLDQDEDKTPTPRVAKPEKEVDQVGSDIQTLCVQLVDCLDSVEKRIAKIGEKIKDWRENVTIEELMEMETECLDVTSERVDNFVFEIKDLSLVLQDAIQTLAATSSEV